MSRRRRVPRFEADLPVTDTVGHLIRTLGIPPTEVGRLTLDGRAVGLAARPTGRDGGEGEPVLTVASRERPQPTRRRPPRFLLDVHLGSLARRLRILGIDTAYETGAEDAHLVERAIREERVLLTKDRGLLHRTALPEGALVRGDTVDEQLNDVLDRFAPPLAPSTLCPLCGAALAPVSTQDIAGELPGHTRAHVVDFSRCTGCGHVYWRGAHFRRLDAVIAAALRQVGTGIISGADRSPKEP